MILCLNDKCSNDSRIMATLKSYGMTLWQSIVAVFGFNITVWMGFSVLQGANTLNSSIWTVLSFWWRHCLWSAKTTIFSCKYDEIDRTISNEFYFVYFSISSQFPRTLRWKWFVLGIQRIRRNYGTRTDQTHAYHRSHIQPLSHCFFSFFLAAQNADRQREGGI